MPLYNFQGSVCLFVCLFTSFCISFTQSGMTAAHDAAALGQLQCLQYLLESTHCSAKDRTLEGATVLHIACKFGRVELVRWLVEEGGCSPGEKGGNDVTPVHLCAARGRWSQCVWQCWAGCWELRMTCSGTLVTLLLNNCHSVYSTILFLSRFLSLWISPYLPCLLHRPAGLPEVPHLPSPVQAK